MKKLSIVGNGKIVYESNPEDRLSVIDENGDTVGFVTGTKNLLTSIGIVRIDLNLNTDGNLMPITLKVVKK